MPAAVAVAAVVVSAASAAYSAYAQNEAAEEQRDALEKQQQQEREASAIQAENLRRQSKQIQAQQQSSLAQGGVLLGDAGSTGIQLSKDIETDLLRNLGTNALQTDWKIGNLEAQKNMLPSAGSLAAGAGLNFAGSALSTYSSYQQASRYNNLLTSQSNSRVDLGTGQSVQPYSSTGIKLID